MTKLAKITLMDLSYFMTNSGGPSGPGPETESSITTKTNSRGWGHKAPPLNNRMEDFTMKNFFLAAALFFVLICGMFHAVAVEQPAANLYPQTFKVISVDYYENLVTVEDFNGNVWQFWGAEDWVENDICSAIMSDNGTDSIYDDSFVMVRYSGWIEGSWGY